MVQIGKILLIEFDDQDKDVFDEIMRALERHPAFERMKLNSESLVSLPGLDIYPERRKVYCGGKETKLTVKEYELLKLLAENQGKVMTYNQLYQHVWKEPVQGIRNNTISYHINNLKKKIASVLPESGFQIHCIREVGYYLDIISE